MTESVSSDTQASYGFLNLDYAKGGSQGMLDSVSNLKSALDSGDVDQQIGSLLQIVSDLKYVINGDLSNTLKLHGLISKQEISQALKESEQQLKQLDTSKKSGIISRIMKILKPILLVVSAILAVVAPSPLTIGLFAFSLFEFIDSSVSQATGKESLLSKAMSAIMKPLENSDMPSWLKKALPALIGLACIAACAYGAGLVGYAALDSMLDLSVSPFTRVMTMMNVGDVEGAQAYLSKVVERVSTAGAVAQVGGNVASQSYNLKASKIDFDIQNIEADTKELENLGSLFSESIQNARHDISNINTISSHF